MAVSNVRQNEKHAAGEVPASEKTRPPRGDWGKNLALPPPKRSTGKTPARRKSTTSRTARPAAEQSRPVRKNSTTAETATGESRVAEASATVTKTAGPRPYLAHVHTELSANCPEVGEFRQSTQRPGSVVLTFDITGEVKLEELNAGLAHTLGRDLEVPYVRFLAGLTSGQLRVEIFPERAPATKGKKYGFLIPADISARIDELREPTETKSRLLLDAFNSHYQDIAQMFTRKKVAGPMPSKDGRTARHAVGPSDTLWVYMLPEQRDVLDDTVDLFDTGNRSALVTKLLAAELDARSAAGTGP